MSERAQHAHMVHVINQSSQQTAAATVDRNLILSTAAAHASQSAIYQSNKRKQHVTKGSKTSHHTMRNCRLTDALQTNDK